MDQHVEPARFVGFNSPAIPFLIGDDIIGFLETTFFKLDIADHHLILVDALLDLAVGIGDFHHLQAKISELVRGEEGAVRPAEGHPRNVRL